MKPTHTQQPSSDPTATVTIPLSFTQQCTLLGATTALLDDLRARLSDEGLTDAERDRLLRDIASAEVLDDLVLRAEALVARAEEG
ncbi:MULTISPECIES: hypothetical protein [Actinomyces]|uniref:Uncharacterized protein n=1 Tax=Actinomyces marmotae TaxID=2737173 RepID=A0A6M8B8B1_9ACTO|nr:MULTISPECIES: hypothetical protein [Actinomyces]QKD79453.1 hypothetical protein HPC72_03580 [Actinomyces marmotae]